MPEMATNGRKWKRWCKRGGNSNKIVIRGTKRKRGRAGDRGKNKIQSVRCWVITVKNMSRFLNEFVQNVKNGNFECLSTYLVSTG